MEDAQIMRSRGKLHSLRGFRLVLLVCFIFAFAFSPGRNLFAQASPVLVGADTDYTHFAGMAVATAGDYAYVCSVRTGFFIYNVSNPTNPVIVWQTNSYWEAIAVSGNHAYVANHWFGFTIYDISNPTNTVPVGSFNNSSENQAVALAASGNYLYIANGLDGLRIFDISNPSQPVSVGHDTTGISGNWGFLDVAVSNNHAYLHGLHGRIWIFNVSDPANPVNVSTMGDEFEYQNPGRLAVSGNYAYISSITNALYIFDVSNPTNPVSKGKVFCSGTGGSIALSGNYAYLANGALSIVDVSDPDKPLFLASTDNLGSDYYRDVAVSGNFAYMAGINFALSVYSLGSPVLPSLGIHTIGGNSYLSWSAPTPAFAVQQTSDLNTGIWMTLTNTITTVARTNQIILPPPNGKQFYRLKQI